MTLSAEPPTTPADGAHRPEAGVWRRLTLAVLALPVVATLMLLAFAAPLLHSGAHDLPLAVAGPTEAVTQITGALQSQRPGAFTTTTYDSTDAVLTAVADREVIGGIAVDADGITVVTASGAGTPYAAILTAIGTGLESTGATVTYTDVAPLTEADPTGSALASLALPLVFGGLATAVLLVAVVRGRFVHKVVGVAAVSVLAGLATTAVLQYGFDAIDGDFWMTAGGVAGGIAAISLTVLGLESLLGYPGLALGAILMLFIANPLSGMATGPAWLPHPWGQIGQLLPVGASGWVTRSAAYFDGRGATPAWIVLAAWMALGLAMTWIATRRKSSGTTTAARQH